MKRTKVYRRDIPRIKNGPLRRKYATDDAQWGNILEWLEERRAKAAKGFPGTYETRNFYEFGLGAIGEVGGNTSDFIESVGEWEDNTSPQQKRLDLQRIATRLSHTFNPEEKKGDGGGGGEGEGDQQKASGKRPAQTQEEAEEFTTPTKNGGGEDIYGEATDASLFYAVRYLISKLAEHDDFSETVPFGHALWDARRVLASYWNPLMLEEAKQDRAREVDDIYLILDTSGSVSHLANNIAAIAAGSAGIVHLYSGEEARPQKKVNRTSPLRTPRDPFPEWSNQERIHWRSPDAKARGSLSWWNAFQATYTPLYPEWAYPEASFETEVAWFLQREKPPKNSRILFWGDTQVAHIYCPRLLAAMLRPYRAAWLLSEPYRENWPERYAQRTSAESLIYHPGNYDAPEWPKLEAVGIPVIENIQTAEHVRGMLQTLQMLR